MKNQTGLIRKLFTNKNSRESGFTLVEILVAAAMLGVVSLGVMQLTKNVTKTGKRMAQDSTAVQLRMELGQILQSQAACTNSLGGVLVNGALQNVPGGIVDENGRVIAAAGQVIGGNAAVAGGGGQGALTIVSVQARGFVDPGPPITWNLANVQDAWGGANPGRLGLVSVRIMVRKGANNNLTADQLRDQGLGADTFPIEFRVRASIPNAAGAAAIQSCFGDQNAYVEAACNALGGRIDNVDGRCKEIRLHGTATGFFDEPVGGAVYQDLTTAGMETHGLHIDGFNGMPDNNTQAYPGAPGVAGGGLLVGPFIGAVPASGDATINRSVGIGVDAPGLPGDLQVASGLGVGVAPPIGDGDVNINNSLGIGVAAPTGAGDLQVNRSIGVGVAPPATGGDLQVATSIGVGLAPPRVVGDVEIGNDLLVVRDSTIQGNFSVNGNTWLGNGADDFVNLRGNVRNDTVFHGGAINITDDVAIRGDVKLLGNMNVSDGFLTTSQSSAAIGPVGTNDNRFVTKDWVYDQLTNTFDDAQRRAIVSHILQSTTIDDYALIKTDIGNQTIANVLVDNSECAAAVQPMVVGLTRLPVAPAVGGIDRVAVKAECVDTAATCVGPVCLTSDHQMRRPPSATAHTNGIASQNVAGQCLWYNAAGINFFGAGSSLISRHYIRVCPWTFPVMSGLRTSPGWSTADLSAQTANFSVLCCQLTAQD